MQNKIKFFLLLFLFSPLFLFAQDAKEKIQAAKVTFISQKLDLTSSQAQKFWPVYNEFSGKREEIRTQFRDGRKNLNLNSLTEEEAKKFIQRGQNLRQTELDLEKEYFITFLKVITPQQVVKLSIAEHEFKKFLLHKLEERGGKKDSKNEEN